jgi:TatD DNase family protein
MQINIHTHFLAKGLQITSLKHNQTIDYQIHSIGIHPWDLPEEWDEALFENLFTNPNCVAIGEIGLDTLCESDFETQLYYFLKQIELAEKYQLPVILHCVKAWNQMEVVKKKYKPKQTWVFHGFTKINLLDNVLKNNVKISIGAAVMHAQNVQEIVRRVPLTELFLETDDQSNFEISDLYQKVSEIKQISLQSLEDQILENVKNTFQKWQIG